MTRNTNNYDRLYNSMKENFTVANSDCSLGEYMLMKAAQKKSEASLPVAMRPSASRSERTMALICTYVEDKLTIKEQPEKDTIIRSFPLRTSASALLSAVVACAFLISFGIIGATALTPSSNLEYLDASQVETEENVEVSEMTAFVVE